MNKGLKRGAAALFCALTLAVPAYAAEASSYTDVPPGAWYEEAVTYCRESSLLQGTGNGQFSPDVKVTRAMLAAALHRLAGSPAAEDVYGQPVGGYHDDTLLESIFKDPWAIVPFLDGWAVSDPANQVVRFLRTADADGEARTQVTDLGIQFDHPTGMAVDGEGSLYVSETFQGLIKKITPAGEMTTFASGLSEPMGLCWADGALYVAECGGNRILKVDKDRRVTTVAGSGENGYADGPAEQAAFSGPKGVAVDTDGAVYAADTDNGTVRRI